MYYLGIDVHKHDSYIAVLDEDGEAAEEVRVLDANLNEFIQQYAGSSAAIEATSNYYTIYDTLNKHLDVVVADPSQTKAIGSAEVKNDRLAESYVPSEEIRERRALVRGRKRLVEKRTDFKNEVHAVLDKHGIAYDWDPFSRVGREILAGGPGNVHDEVTFDIFDYDGEHYWVSFHGYDGRRGYRGIAKTPDFQTWIAGDPDRGVPADAIHERYDSQNWRED